MSDGTGEELTDFAVRRIRLHTAIPFATFVAALEEQVPALAHPEALERLAEGDGDWAGFVRDWPGSRPAALSGSGPGCRPSCGGTPEPPPLR